MAEKIIKTRIIHKHAKESEWKTATNFIPKNGELIIYDNDSTYNYKRLKIGDGVTKVNSLSFIDGDIRTRLTDLTNDFESFNESITAIIADLQTQINRNDVQISATQPKFACSWFKVIREE